MYPPNPIRNLDNSFTPQQQLGFDIFFGPKTFFDPKAGTRTLCLWRLPYAQPHSQRRFDHQAGVLWLQHPVRGGRNPDNVKTPHLRNLYQKVGKFGFPESPFFLPSPGAGEFRGDQIRALASATMAASTPPSPSALPRTSGVAWRTPTSRSPTSRSWASRLTTRRASRCSRLASPSTRRLMRI